MNDLTAIRSFLVLNEKGFFSFLPGKCKNYVLRKLYESHDAFDMTKRILFEMEKEGSSSYEIFFDFFDGELNVLISNFNFFLLSSIKKNYAENIFKAINIGLEENGYTDSLVVYDLTVGFKEDSLFFEFLSEILHRDEILNIYNFSKKILDYYLSSSPSHNITSYNDV